MTLAVEVYDGSDPSNPANLLRTFTEDDGRTFRVARNDPGTWTVRVPRDSTDSTYCQTHRWVKFRLDGAVVQAGRIAPWTQGTIEEGEESDEVLTLSAPGFLTTLRDAIVYPHSSTGRLARDTRWFNFASPDYPDEASWAAAVQLYEQGNAGTSLPGVDVPEDWPDATAWWIWGTNYNLANSPPQAVGDCYFRTSVTLAAEGDYAMFITCDDGYELWVDGVMLAAQTEAFIWRNTYRIDQFLDAGTHTIAIKGTNMDRPTSPSTNHAGLLFAMYSTTAGGELAVLQVHSDNTWKCKAYPATPPGFTPGEIIKILMDEAYARGAIQAWSYSFGNALDSNGDAWTEEVEQSFRFSDTVLDALNKLGETWIDYTGDPDTIELDMVNKGGLGTTVAVSLQEGQHLAGLTHNGDPARITDGLMRDASGVLTEVSSGGAADPPDGDNPRIEGFVEAGGAGSPHSAERQAAGIFDNAGADRVLVTAGLERITGVLPHVDFQVGDTITMPNRNGHGYPTVIEAITTTDVPSDADGEENGSHYYVVEGYQLV